MKIDCIDGRTGTVAFSHEAPETIKFVEFPAGDGGRLIYEVMRRVDGSAFILLDDAHAKAFEDSRILGDRI